MGLPFRTNKKSEHSPSSSRIVWSPSQEALESPCTKIIKDRKNTIKARALLGKFIEIKIEEEAQKEEEKSKKMYF